MSMASEIKTVSQLKAELTSELESRLKNIETELNKLKAGYSELKGLLKANKAALDELKRYALLKTEVFKDSNELLHLK